VKLARRLFGVLAASAVAVIVFVPWGGGGEGTVVAKPDQGVYDFACEAGGAMNGPVAVPVWGSCSAPRCWRLVVRDGDGNIFQPCVSREERDRARLGEFWHERTDQ
jgi:hypothetical protein